MSRCSGVVSMICNDHKYSYLHPLYKLMMTFIWLEIPRYYPAQLNAKLSSRWIELCYQLKLPFTVVHNIILIQADTSWWAGLVGEEGNLMCNSVVTSLVTHKKPGNIFKQYFTSHGDSGSWELIRGRVETWCTVLTLKRKTERENHFMNLQN